MAKYKKAINIKKLPEIQSSTHQLWQFLGICCIMLIKIRNKTCSQGLSTNRRTKNVSVNRPKGMFYSSQPLNTFWTWASHKLSHRTVQWKLLGLWIFAGCGSELSHTGMPNLKEKSIKWCSGPQVSSREAWMFLEKSLRCLFLKGKRICQMIRIIEFQVTEWIAILPCSFIWSSHTRILTASQ